MHTKLASFADPITPETQFAGVHRRHIPDAYEGLRAIRARTLRAIAANPAVLGATDGARRQTQSPYYVSRVSLAIGLPWSSIFSIDCIVAWIPGVD